MRVLISEDSERKYIHIQNVVKKVLGEDTEIERVVYAKAGVVKLKNEKYDYLIQDMQLPINSDGRIDIKGGLYVLNQVKYRKLIDKYCICSSDVFSYELMKENGFKNVPFVDYSSDMFFNDLKEFLNTK